MLGGGSMETSVGRAGVGRVAWPQLPGRPAAALRVWQRLAGARRDIALAMRTARADALRLEDAALLRSRAYSLSRLFARLCAQNGMRIAVSGPIPRGPVVLTANHVGYLDPVAVGSIVPCIPVAKREVERWPLIGRVGREHGVLFVRRGDAASGARALRVGQRVLAARVSLLNFPEGTTTTGETVLPFRRGVFGLARIADVPVVPVALSCDDAALTWTGDDPFLPHFVRTLARREIVLRVRFGCAMTPRRYGSAEDLAREAHAVVEHLLAA
ncbi:MAG: lysophospholipid acyltransferase family protein [Thermodesulfobacteriota bacterium]